MIGEFIQQEWTRLYKAKVNGRRFSFIPLSIYYCLNKTFNVENNTAT